MVTTEVRKGMVSPPDKKYVLYGAGKTGRAFLHLAGKNRISAFIDRNPNVNEIEGVPVIHSWDNGKTLGDEELVIVVTVTNSVYLAEITHELEQIGMEYLLAKDALKMFLDSKKYVLFGIDALDYMDFSYPLGVLGEENVLCCSDVWNIERKDITLWPYLLLEEIVFLRDEGVIADFEIVILTQEMHHFAAIVLVLNRYHLKYRLVDDIAKEQILKEVELYIGLNKRKNFEFHEDLKSLCLRDKYQQAAQISSYFWQDLWAAKRIYKNKPDIHYDIGSRIDGFITHLLSFGQKVKMLDIRPFPIHVDGLEFVETDATYLREVDDESVESLSALCSLEHFGLGRYGDLIDPDACFKCFSAIEAKMKKGGKLYISVSIGNEHLEFNGQRIFYAGTIVESFPQMKLYSFSVCHAGAYEANCNIHKYDNVQNDLKGGQRFGLFEFIKK